MTTFQTILKAQPPSWVEKAYRPIIRAYLAVLATYYFLINFTHLAVLDGHQMISMSAIATTACLACAFGAYKLRNPVSFAWLEWKLVAINLLVVANVMVALSIGYEQAKLIYFIICIMIFALASISMKQALISVLAAVGGLFAFVGLRQPDQLETYGYLTFAAGIAAVAIANVLRNAIERAGGAQSKAEQQLAEAKYLGETMRQRSLSDSLTKLPNRRAFFESFRKYRAHAKQGKNCWLVLIDLDGFKSVNDIYGHIIGDELLKRVADSLTTYCGDKAFVSRMGGDEFNLILHDEADIDDVVNWCEQLLIVLSRTFHISGRLIQISGSMGCVQIDGEQEATRQINSADYALMHAKRSGKNRVVLFDDTHAQLATERFKVEHALRMADFSKEIELLYQPQVDLNDEIIVRAEALARWHSPSLGTIEPANFIEVAEETGLIAHITMAVLGRALEELKSSVIPVPLSINLSSQDLISDQVIDQVVDRVRASRIDPSLIEFEVTETAMMADVQKASANLKRLADCGHSVALDDFGTGYSNFAYLRNLPITKLKVDRSFLENLGDPMTEKILFSLAGMARTLGVHCLLEGIEDELGLVLAKRVGAESVQGYLFGKPMSSEDLRSVIAQGMPALDCSN